MTLFPLDSFPADRPAAIDDLGKVLSYGELALISVRLASSINARTVAIVLVRNTLGCVATIVALIKQGVVPILLDASAPQATIALYMSRYQPEVIALPSDLQAHYPNKRSLLVILDYALYSSGLYNSSWTPHPDLTLLMCTSGSTGNPKLVRLSRSNLLSNAQSIATYLNIDIGDRPITSLPLHYSYGFSILSSHLQLGATLLVTNRSVMDKLFWGFFSEAKATSLSGVPYTYLMLKRLGFLRKDSGALRTLTQAGGKLSEDLVREFAEFATRSGIDFYVMYGQTEATARISYVPASSTLEKAGSIGVAIPGGELFLVGPDGREIISSEVQGELGYRGPNVTMGYSDQRPDLVKGDERKNFLLTGDLAHRDSDGYYYITGRLSRIAKMFGKRVSLDDLEQICLGLVTEVACTGAEDQVNVWITNSEHQSTLPSLLAERTAIHASAFKVLIIDSLPRTTAGKTDYQLLIGEALA